MASYRDEDVDSPRLAASARKTLSCVAVLNEGRFFTEQLNRHRSAVVVLGSAADEALFPNGGGVGKKILIDGRRYSATGTLEKRKEGPFGSDNEDDGLFLVPFETLRRHYPAPTTTSSPSARARDVEVQDEVVQVLGAVARSAGTKKTTSTRDGGQPDPELR